MSHEGYPHYASYESYSMMQSSAGLYYDYSRPKLTPGGRETRYVMLEINGKPTPVPCYSIEDYGFADTATNAPLPGETPEETLARRKKDDIRMKRYTELLQRRSQTYAQSTTLPPSAMTQTPVHPSLSHHYTTGPAHWQVQQVRHPVSDSSSGSQHHQYSHHIETPQPRFAHQYLPHQTAHDGDIHASAGHSSWQSEHQGNNPVFLHQPALTIDTQVQIQSSGDDQYSSHSSTSDSWRSPAPESPRNYFTDGSFPPETPTEKSASPSLPTPSTPVDLLSLPPRNRDSPPSSGSPAPKADTRTNSAKAAAYDQLLTYRPIGPKRKDHEAKASPARPPFASQIPTAESVVVNIPKPRQKATRIACRFCRGRKIACGPPPADGDGRTCNQCLRRGMRCVYPEETHRGPGKHRRNNPGPSPTVSAAPQTFVDVFNFNEGQPSSSAAVSNIPSPPS